MTVTLAVKFTPLTATLCDSEATVETVKKPATELTDDDTVGVEGVPANLTSSIRSEAVPLFTKRIFKPLICAAIGNVRVLAKYQPVAAFAASLKSAAEVFPRVTQAVPFQ